MTFLDAAGGVSTAGGVSLPWRSMSLLLRLALVLILAGPPYFGARVWFVDNHRPSGGDGTAASPFASLAEVEKVSAPGDLIVVLAGAEPYSQGIVLKDGQSLVGQSGDIRGALARAKIDAPAPATGPRPVLSVTGAAPAISMTGSAFVEGLAITGGSGPAVRVDGGRGEVTFVDLTVDRVDGAAVVVRGHEGAVTFGKGSTIRVTAGQSDAISLRDSRTVVTFAEPLAIATAGARALVADKVTRVVVPSGSVLEAADAPVLELRDVELDVTLARISASGPSEAGVILERTRGRIAVGGGTVRGTRRRGFDIRSATNVEIRNVVLEKTAGENSVPAAECAGDLLAHDNTRCSAAILLQDVEGVVVEDVRIEGSGQLGISGRGVRNAAFRGVQIIRAGDEIHEHALVFRNLTGEVSFSNCTISQPASRGLYVVNDEGSASMTVENCRLSENTASTGQQGILIDAQSSARIAVRVLQNHFSGLHGAAVQISADGKSSLDVSIEGNTVQRTGGAVSLLADEHATVTFGVADNRISGSSVNAINVALSANATAAAMKGTIVRNHVRFGGPSRCPGCSAISLRAGGTGTISAAVHGNDVAFVTGPAIWAQAGQRSRMDIAITSNLLSEPAGADFGAIRVQAGVVAADTATVCTRIGGGGALANTILGRWDERGAIQLVNRSASKLLLAGLKSGGTAAASAWLQEQNRGGSTRFVLATPPREDAVLPGGECPVPAVK